MIKRAQEALFELTYIIFKEQKNALGRQSLL